MSAHTTTDRDGKQANANGPDPHYVLLGTVDVRAMLGGISNMTLWRLRRTEGNGFPEPLSMNGRLLWRLSDVQRYIDNLGRAA